MNGEIEIVLGSREIWGTSFAVCLPIRHDEPENEYQDDNQRWIDIMLYLSPMSDEIA